VGHHHQRRHAHRRGSRARLLLERIAEIRAGDTWRNVAAELQHLKVVEYDRGDARVQQTSGLRKEAEALLGKLHVPPPPKVHAIAPVPAPDAAPQPAAS
jgi:hypothetical protein